MKKKIAIILAVSALVTSSLVSCGGEKLPPKEKVDHVYKTTEVDIGNISYASEILTVRDDHHPGLRLPIRRKARSRDT
ncbi:MAG: hypothetical protein ACLR5G_06205 [Eubacteriales bacterium]